MLRTSVVTLVVMLAGQAAASSFKATSTAKLEAISDGDGGTIEQTTTTNVRFVFEDAPLEIDPSLPPFMQGFAGQRLYKVTQVDTRVSGREGGGGPITIEGYDAKSGKQRWTTKDAGDDWHVNGSYFVMTTEKYGCCGGQNSFRAMSTMTGKALFPFSFTTFLNLPVILRGGAFVPEKFRFIAYHDNYWPMRDKLEMKDPDGGKLTLAGVLTYASPMRVIDRLAIFYDQAAANDPSSDPEKIIVTHPSKSWTFSTDEANRTYEADYWWRGTDGRLSPKASTDEIFDGLTISLVFWGKDTIDIPLKKDRLGKAEAKGTFFKKVIVLPTDGWQP